MTALTAEAQMGIPGRPRLADLGWNTVRQHRLALIGLAIVFAGFGLRLVLSGVPVHATYAQYLAHHCVAQRHPACGQLLTDMAMTASWMTRYTGLLVLPGLIGVFIGAPLVAHDFETGAYRFGLTQGVNGRRQLAAKLLVIGTATVVGSCMLGLLTMWCLAPLHRISLGFDTGISYWRPEYFNITAVTLPVWALFDFCLGMLAGAAIKRSVPSMAAALAGSFAALVAWPVLTERLMRFRPVAVRSPPVLSQLNNGARPGRITEFVSNPSGWPGPHGSWQVSGWFTGPGGRHLPWATVQPMLDRIPVPTAISPDRLRAWLATRHLTYWIGYQPASRYWLFQCGAAVILITLAAAAGVLAIRLAGRRA